VQEVYESARWVEYEVCLAAKAAEPAIAANPDKLPKKCWLSTSHSKIAAPVWVYVQENAANNPAIKTLLDNGRPALIGIITEKNANYIGQSGMGPKSCKKLHAKQIALLKAAASSSSSAADGGVDSAENEAF
jgi:hypothetical protein